METQTNNVRPSSFIIDCCHRATNSISMHRQLFFSLLGGGFLLIGYILDQQQLSTAAIILYAMSYVIGGYFKAKEGILDLINDRSLNVEILMMLAAIGAASIGYWGEGAILIFIFSLSGAMETYTWQKSEKDLSNLIEMAPDKATVIDENGNMLSVSVDEIEIGNKVIVKPGERIPVDGTVLTGETTVDESTLTGEPLPVEKTKGSLIFNGTMNGKGSMTVEVTKRNVDSLFQKMIQLVKQAKSERPPTQQWIEKVEGPYVIIVLTFVALMLIVPYTIFGWNFQDTFYRAMVLLVVASPCAVVASVMPALLSAISTGARNGILMKGGVFLEQLSKSDVIAFDKTGTITTGVPEVTDVFLQEEADESYVYSVVTAIEQQSNHPLAKALVQFSQSKADKKLPIVETIHDVTGYGVEATIDHCRWAIGNWALMKRTNTGPLTDEWCQREKIWQKEGKTVVYVSKDEEVVASFAVKDQVRSDAKETLKALHDMGIKTVMITGDHEATAASIAKEAGVDDWIAECLPEQKVHEVDRLRKKYDSVIMVGDGVNDAPALAKSHIGVAMGSGTDIAIDTADLVLMKSELNKIRFSLELSKRMNRIIKQNLIFSISIIVILIAANFAQSLTLPLGVIGHEGSTILVILNGLRLLKA
ncbi:heavy metal translocating P-type ATPase [Evansella sp. AB-P1]|uniref:heavy metal translocating P-type ATPase n=1 Tax=Evansella sp. AB-P1 TaxID=3037653 RepID=UPI00241EE11B|nr:heavy metal translocating P-type ATPase [Evansella sp. AB-P1]MDG5787368.1 heavy metal translocating P-type ATPase [Evansella sp. AB-P1]